MRYWVFTIAGGDGGQELGSGWIRAGTPDGAMALISHPGANLYEIPDDTGFPAEATGTLHWEHRGPELKN